MISPHHVPAHTVTVTGLSGAVAATNAGTQLHTPETLADAIERINDLGGGTIEFKSGLSGTIHLTHALPPIGKPTRIAGPGTAELRLSGDDKYSNGSILTVDDYANVSGLTLEHGYAKYGGAIHADAASLFVEDVALTGNRAKYSGGAIWAEGNDSGEPIISYPVELGDVTITGNRAVDRYGGGIATNWDSIVIESSTISGNTAETDGGLAIIHHYGATIADSTISGNRASGLAGGGYLGGTTSAGEQSVSIVASTITGNTGSAAGGLQVYGAAATLTADTIAQNHATSDGEQTAGGLELTRLTPSDFGSVLLRNTILAANTGGAEPDVYLTNGATLTSEFSLIGDVNGVSIGSGDGNILGSTGHLADPDLGPLGDHGGLTETMLPKLASPVIDAGEAFDLSSDQRGDPRTVDLLTVANATGSDGTDIGAAELQRSDISPIVVTGVIGDQRLTLSVPAPAACGTPTMRVPVSWRSLRLKRSHRARLKVKHVALTVVGAGSPAATSRRASGTARLKLGGQTASVGIHHVKLRVTYTKHVKRRDRTRTVRVTKSLTGPFTVCAAPSGPTP